ncbi:MAG TPA: type III pantothenate kinase [bacterium]|nr:type III pantothenate kinase [bacterium]HNT66678.1 type III pantothenate kinase [bacterium]HOX87029.1 type III pantothenate kinase [bacterium]HPG46360.1 type III pantothenate kinase [bacterium]HPM98726.1 type III pantothenate kinase [bacterium]
MLLAVDIGNTQIAAGLYAKDKLKAHWRLASTRERTEDETWVMLEALCRVNGHELSQTTGLAISSVVPDMTPTFVKMASKYLHLEPLVVTHTLDLGLPILYKPASNVGADRLCNAVAGLAKYGAPLIIVDLGTATTFDVISKHGEYIGGVIAPGVEMSSAILHQRAAKLPRVALQFPATVIGNSTESSMQSGLMYGTVDLIDGLVKRIQQEMGEQVRTIATGGLARFIMEKIGSIDTIDSFLTLEGLRLIYERQKR